ncbi:heme ABC transporter permease [Candidatus Endobugula sertula]|uniref:Heme exporter protein C n=1 Tax=Candidatus Endobugula sertula TaxID=62101 RepID=A0A1D2QT78_9GAMM|nr:heme ABC transporter permease [Candidatus Endobugula sertula]
MGWQWFHRLGSPRWFYEKTSRWMFWLALVTVVLLIVGTVWGLAFAPMDSKQGNSYRIIFIHVPTAFLALAGYYVMAIAGAVGIIWQIKLSYMVMRSAATIGAVLTFIALLTGAVWGKPTWGTWWVWDARITSMLVLFFLYLGVIALQGAYQNGVTANKASAILALVGTVNIPIIYKSVDWWFTLHQPATLKFMGESSIDISMAYPLLVMISGFYCLYAWLMLHWTRAEIVESEQKTVWVRDLLKG